MLEKRSEFTRSSHSTCIWAAATEYHAGIMAESENMSELTRKTDEAPKQWAACLAAVFLSFCCLSACDSYDPRANSQTERVSRAFSAPTDTAVSVVFRMTSANLGDSPPPFIVLGGLKTVIKGTAFTSITGDVFECGDPGAGDLSCVENFFYPDPNDPAKSCPPKNSPAGAVCVAPLNRIRNDQWMHKTRVELNGSNQVPIEVTIPGVAPLITLSELKFRLNLDISTVVATPVPPDANQGIRQLTSNCVTLAAGGTREPVFCWAIEVKAADPVPVDFPWNVVDPDPASSAPRDQNGAPLNPRWNWQTQFTEEKPVFGRNCPSSGCTSQPTTENAPANEFLGATPFTCESNALGEGAKGHLNWEVVTYVGPLSWDGHSTFDVSKLKFDSPDDDYNINMDTLKTNGFESGTTGANNSVHLEFKASETIDRFSTTPYWDNFRKQVDDGSSNPQGVNGKQAIAIGLLGLDEVHDLTSELHPVFGLAIHSKDNDPAADIWDLFARNFGNEGFCSGKMEHLISPAGRNAPLDMTFELPRPPNVSPTAVPTIASDLFTQAADTRSRVSFRMTSVILGSAPPRVDIGRLHHDQDERSDDEISVW